MSLKEKCIRSINWDEKEKLLLRSILKEFATIIENKSLDTNHNKLKTKAWEEVHKKFNGLNGRLRSLNQLKIQWKTMKINARKEVSLFKKSTNKTGGGGRPQTPTNEVIEINDLLNPAELLRDENIYDSDGIDINENIVQTDLDVCKNIHLRKQEAGGMSVVTVIENHIPAARNKSKDHEPAVSQESIASMFSPLDAEFYKKIHKLNL